jgi:hypothetical protein
LLRRDGACMREGVARRPWMAGGMGTDEAGTRTHVWALDVWSFGRSRTFVTIQRGAVITIFGVRQQR